MKKVFKLIIGLLILTGIVYSCSSNDSEEIYENDTQLIYKRSDLTAEENFTHYRTIRTIEKISKNSIDFQNVVSQIPSVKDYSGEILKYSYDEDIKAYKFGDIFIYNNKDKYLPVKSVETLNSNNVKTITMSNALNSEIYYKMAINNDDSSLSSFEKVNRFPLEKLGFDKSLSNILTKQTGGECDDLSWGDCMDCTVRDCGSRWWCVGLLVVAGPETLVGMAVSCTMDL